MTTNTENDQSIRNSPVNGLARIKSLVQRFAVCWESHPEQAVVTVLDRKEHAFRVKKELRKIGFSIELYGTPEARAENISPGSNRCLGVEAGLKEIAQWVLSHQEGRCTSEINPEPQSLIYSRARADRPDVRVTIQILHRDNWDQPIDEVQWCCLKQMERVLHEVGACDGAWRPQA